MELPSARELELETALRQRNAQVADLSDEVIRLRRYISANPPSPNDTASVPPALMAVLLPHIQGATTNLTAGGTVNSALAQRVKTVQNENDELYDLLKKSETGRLKEEVRSLSRVVNKLESALRDSHKIILSLSTELDKTHETFAKNNNLHRDPKHSPRNSYPPQRHSPSLATTSTGKVPPTGPRSHKKPRLSESQPKRDETRETRGRNHNHNHGHHRSHSRSQKMDVDREGEKERERDRDDRDGNRSRKSSASNGFPHTSRGGRRNNGGASNASAMASGDRTLAERMGLDGSRF